MDVFIQKSFTVTLRQKTFFQGRKIQDLRSEKYDLSIFDTIDSEMSFAVAQSYIQLMMCNLFDFFLVSFFFSMNKSYALSWEMKRLYLIYMYLIDCT